MAGINVHFASSPKKTGSCHLVSKNIRGGFGTGKISGMHGSAGKGKADSTYESVTDQAGIYAGQEGFNIEVGKNTDLKGAVISSDATPDKNKLSTDTLTYSNIENKAECSASSSGASYNNGRDTKYNEQGFTPNIGTPAKGDASSICRWNHVRYNRRWFHIWSSRSRSKRSSTKITRKIL